MLRFSRRERVKHPDPTRQQNAFDRKKQALRYPPAFREHDGMTGTVRTDDDGTTEEARHPKVIDVELAVRVHDIGIEGRQLGNLTPMGQAHVLAPYFQRAAWLPDEEFYPGRSFQ
jgi:hypothetical protein